MNVLEIAEFASLASRHFASALAGTLKLINPVNVDPVFKNLKILPMMFLIPYVLLLALPFFAGYYYHFAVSQATPLPGDIPNGNAFKLALRNYLIAVLVPMAMAYALYLFDLRLLRRKVPHAEALTVIAYACGPGIIGGIFRASVKGLPDTWILHLFLIMYSIYLVFAAISSRFGYERSIMPFMFLTMTGFIAALISYKALEIGLGIPPQYTGL